MLDHWTADELDAMIREASLIADIGLRIEFLSRKFLGTPYRNHTLKGGIKIPEILVLNLEGMDCFTFLDYIEAMRLSGSFPEFTEQLKRVRYRSDVVSYRTRNHFFTDWIESNRDFVRDVTEQVGGRKTKRAAKNLNMREDGISFLPGIKTQKRVVAYIPSAAVDEEMMGKLQTGDYAGMYTSAAGLDVTHVGILIQHGDSVLFRHASSSPEQRKVTDQDLSEYLPGHAGLIILRPKNQP